MAQNQGLDVWAVVEYGRGGLICDYDSIDEVDTETASIVPTEPQENGELYAYDKVSQPNTIKLTLLFSGNQAKQSAALAKLEEARLSTKLYTIVTPFRYLERMALIGVSETRASTNGVSMLSVELTFQEVRVAQVGGATAQWEPANPTSANQQDVGKKNILFKDGKDYLLGR